MNRVEHVNEAPQLRAAAVDGQVLVEQRLAHESRQHHPVGSRLSRADGVEEPYDDRVGAVLSVVTVCERLTEGLRRRVAPARLEGGTENPIGGFVKRFAAVLSVDLRG